jgi:hypothetical protein
MSSKKSKNSTKMEQRTLKILLINIRILNFNVVVPT